MAAGGGSDLTGFGAGAGGGGSDFARAAGGFDGAAKPNIVACELFSAGFGACTSMSVAATPSRPGIGAGGAATAEAAGGAAAVVAAGAGGALAGRTKTAPHLEQKLPSAGSGVPHCAQVGSGIAGAT